MKLEEFSPNLLDSLYILRLAWDNVRPETIKNCFEHCGFKFPTESTCADTDTTASGRENEFQLLDRLRTEGAKLSEDITFESYVNVDSGVVTIQQNFQMKILQLFNDFVYHAHVQTHITDYFTV